MRRSEPDLGKRRVPDDVARRPRPLAALGIGAGQGILAMGLVAGFPSAAQARDPIVYRFVPPEDVWKAKPSENFRTYRDENGEWIFEFRKPAHIPGSRNYVAEVRPADATYVEIRSEKGDVLFEEESFAWSTRSTATEDRYYVMDDAWLPDEKSDKTTPYRLYPNRYHNFSYWLVLVKDGSVRRFTCRFDNDRLTGPRDRKVMRAMNNDQGTAAEIVIARFLSQHGADMQAEGCEPDTPEADTAPN